MYGSSMALTPTTLDTPCREYPGPRWPNGYGEFKQTSIHRWVWAQINGPIPPGVVIRHRCDNPPCFVYDHLLAGTQLDNMRVMAEKGRRARTGYTLKPLHGEANRRAKLTADDIQDIRRRCAAGEPQSVIGADFGVSQTTISKIKLGLRWRHLPDQEV